MFEIFAHAAAGGPGSLNPIKGPSGAFAEWADSQPESHTPLLLTANPAKG